MWKSVGVKSLSGLWKKYKFVLLVFAAGAVLLLLPDGKSGRTAAAETVEQTEEAWLSSVQRQMTELLSGIDGAGEVRLLLTVDMGRQQELAKNSESETDSGSERRKSETVILSDGGGGEETVVTRSFYPVFRGAVVVCEGGGEASVRLAISQAVSAVTGLSSDKISVLKGKSR